MASLTTGKLPQTRTEEPVKAIEINPNRLGATVLTVS
jgi:hypothetical protein